MLKAKFIPKDKKEKTFEYPPLKVGQSASFTDYTNHPNGEILVIRAEKGKGHVDLSKSGLSYETVQGKRDVRATFSTDLEHIITIDNGQTYERPHAHKSAVLKKVIKGKLVIEQYED